MNVRSTVILNSNTPVHNGGSVFLENKCNISFEGHCTVTFYGNRAEDGTGGAISTDTNAAVKFKDNSTILFHNNHATQGVGIYSSYNCLTFSKNTTVTFNDIAAAFGGA